jgi:hypothetical protein
MAAFAHSTHGEGIGDLLPAAESVLKSGQLMKQRSGLPSLRIAEQLTKSMNAGMLPSLRIAEQLTKSMNAGMLPSLRIAEQLTKSMNAGMLPSLRIAEQLTKSMNAFSAPALSSRFAASMAESMEALSNSNLGSRLAESIGTFPALDFNIEFTERLQTQLALLTGPGSYLDTSSRMAISHVLNDGVANALNVWSASSALNAVDDLWDVIEFKRDKAEEETVSHNEWNSLSAAVALFLALVAVTGPWEALQSVWTVGLLIATLIGHLDNTSPAFHGLLVVVGLLAIVNWRR